MDTLCYLSSYYQDTLCYQDTLFTLHMIGYDTVYILYNENTQDRTLSQDIANYVS